jgi:Protein of unknown function (DUF2809)
VGSTTRRIEMKRNRLLYLLIGCVVVLLALATRRYAAFLPEFIATYAGDTLWAVMAFLVFGFVFPRWSTARVAAAALLLSYADEVSQLYHAPWIDSVRGTWLGGLVLGFGFLWSDILCYTIGVMLGAVAEVVFYKSLNSGSDSNYDMTRQVGEGRNLKNRRPW